jgi:hypothetical protein
LQLGDGLGQVFRLVRVERIGTAVADVAERAAAGALVAHDHEGRGALAEAFADVGAGRFFAHRHQVVGAQDVLDFVEAGGRRAGLDANPVGLLELFWAGMILIGMQAVLPAPFCLSLGL